MSDYYENRIQCLVFERDRLRADLAAANRELERWRHGVTIEGDFVCPNELEAVNLRAELDRLNKYIATHDDEYATMKETLRAEHQECQRLRGEVERMRAVYEAAQRWHEEMDWQSSRCHGEVFTCERMLYDAIDTALSQDKEQP